MAVDVTTITVADFKAQFFRGFAYLPVYDPTATYNTGDEAYYNGLFYSALVDGVSGVTPGTDNTKWQKIVDSLDNWVQDQDITNAFAEAQTVFNQGLYGADSVERAAGHAARPPFPPASRY